MKTTRSNRKHRLPRRIARGFTLVEMVAVIVLLGIVITVVSGPIMNRFSGAKYNAGKVGAGQLAQAVQNYQMDNGNFPGQLSDLVTRPGNATNWLGPYTKEANLKDPFGHSWSIATPQREVSMEELQEAVKNMSMDCGAAGAKG